MAWLIRHTGVTTGAVVGAIEGRRVSNPGVRHVDGCDVKGLSLEGVVYVIKVSGGDDGPVPWGESRQSRTVERIGEAEA